MGFYNKQMYVFIANAQVTHWRGCYDDICEYRRTEATSNSPEFAKKAGKCSRVIIDLHTSTTPLRCCTMPFECPETKQEYTKNTLQNGEDTGEFTREIIQVGELNAILEESANQQSTKEESVENKEEYLANLLRTRR